MTKNKRTSQDIKNSFNFPLTVVKLPQKAAKPDDEITIVKYKFRKMFLAEDVIKLKKAIFQSFMKNLYPPENQNNENFIVST